MALSIELRFYELTNTWLRNGILEFVNNIRLGRLCRQSQDILELVNTISQLLDCLVFFGLPQHILTMIDLRRPRRLRLSMRGRTA